MKDIIIATLLAACALAACGGGGGDGEDADAQPETVPDPAGDGEDTAPADPPAEDAPPDGVPDAVPDIETDEALPDSPPDTPVDIPPDGLPPGDWLYTSGSHIYLPGGAVFRGRGANLPDTRSCNACTYMDPNPGEVMRRADELIDAWGANLIRLDLESYASSDGYRVHYMGILDDSEYLEDIKDIVAHVAGKPGVYILLSLWVDPTFSDLGWPTEDTIRIWERLAAEFQDESRVLYGLCNEPQSNFDGAQDAEVWQAMNDAVAAIRAVEDGAGKPHHVIAAQGTGGWSRRLDYYLTHPITAGGGENIAYEVHVYNPESDFESMWVEPARTIPVIIGEFGPFDTTMNLSDCAALQVQARTAEVPHIAWVFHMRCDPNLLVENSGGGCGVDMALEPTEWGQLLIDNLAVAW